jgi:hypothetical protein
MRVGIMLGDNSSDFVHGKQNRNNLHKFFTSDKIAFDILKNFPKGVGVELELIKRAYINNLSNLTNGKGFDFLVSIQCHISGGLGGFAVRYHSQSTQGKDLASLFHRNISPIIKIPDLGTILRSDADSDGIAMKNIEAPCIVVEVFPSEIEESKVQQLLNRYDAIIEAYIKSIIEAKRVLNR